MIDIAIRVGLVYVFSIIGIHSGDPETGSFSIWACMEKTSCIICAVTTLRVSSRYLAVAPFHMCITKS